jgi:putative transposase
VAVAAVERHGRTAAAQVVHGAQKERVKRRIYPTRATATSGVFDYIEMFYNPIRRHGSAGGVSPVGFERPYAQSGD